MKLKPVFNRIIVEAPKGIIIPDAVSYEVGFGPRVAIGGGFDLRVEDRVLYVRSAAVSCGEVPVSVDILRIDGVLAVVCDE
ncbi:MAG: hypothetical protein ACKESB_00110 [Candidatus Hodgkinia cicadicola]